MVIKLILCIIYETNLSKLRPARLSLVVRALYCGPQIYLDILIGPKIVSGSNTNTITRYTFDYVGVEINEQVNYLFSDTTRSYCINSLR